MKTYKTITVPIGSADVAESIIASNVNAMRKQEDAAFFSGGRKATENEVIQQESARIDEQMRHIGGWHDKTL